MSDRSNKERSVRLQEYKKIFNQAINKDFNVIDVIVMAVLFTICFFCFLQGDIIVTGNRSFLMHTNLLDFYDACYQWTQDYGANYLPSTFILFSIWNLPLRLFGRVPSEVLTNALLNNFWYKLLPVLFFFASAIVIYKICIFVGMGVRKAKICKYAFLVCPIAVFSQMIFGQYDIFTVFFILLGFYYFLKKQNNKFILFFSIAITFKYQALIYFLVFLLLREKRIFKILKSVILVAIPTLIEIAIYYPSENFRKSVLGFSALSYVETGIDLGGLKPISPFLAAVLFLLVAAYIINGESKEDSLFRWCVFLANGVSFAFFGLASFHPQWLLLTVPFLVLTLLTSRHCKLLLLVQNIYIVALYILVVNIWPGNVDQNIMLNSPIRIFKESLGSIQMKDVYVYDNLNYAFTCIWVIMIVYFVLSYPKYSQSELNRVEQDTMINVRISFIVGVAAWVIPAFMCLI